MTYPKKGKYRHFKGGEYELLYIARHSENDEAMVVYRALYEGADPKTTIENLFTRTLKTEFWKE